VIAGLVLLNERSVGTIYFGGFGLEGGFDPNAVACNPAPTSATAQSIVVSAFLKPCPVHHCQGIMRTLISTLVRPLQNFAKPPTDPDSFTVAKNGLPPVKYQILTCQGKDILVRPFGRNMSP